MHNENYSFKKSHETNLTNNMWGLENESQPVATNHLSNKIVKKLKQANEKKTKQT